MSSYTQNRNYWKSFFSCAKEMKKNISKEQTSQQQQQKLKKTSNTQTFSQ